VVKQERREKKVDDVLKASLSHAKQRKMEKSLRPGCIVNMIPIQVINRRGKERKGGVEGILSLFSVGSLMEFDV
jgi:hypothetical protein